MNASLPCSMTYDQRRFDFFSVLYNVTLSPNLLLLNPTSPAPLDLELTKLVSSIEEGYLEYYLQNDFIEERITDSKIENTAKQAGKASSNKISVSYQAYPLNQKRFTENANIEASEGPFYFFFPPMLCFVTLMLEVIREKDLKLRKET